MTIDTSEIIKGVMKLSKTIETDPHKSDSPTDKLITESFLCAYDSVIKWVRLLVLRKTIRRYKMGGDRELQFEEQNWNWLIDKFLKDKEVADLWADFVYNEYNNSLREPDDYDDDAAELHEKAQEDTNPEVNGNA